MSAEKAETVQPGRSVAEIRRQPIATQDVVPVLDTAKFEHMQRIALTIAQSSLVPKHLKDSDDRRTIANCFRVVNQAVRWGFDPFSVVDETYVVHGKLGFQGKLIAAVVNAKAGLQQRLSYSYNDKKGDDLEVTVSGTFIGETEPRSVTVRVGDAKTDNGMWTKDPRQKLIYTGATKWARAYCPELTLGLLTDDDLDRMVAERAVDVTPPPRPTREQFRAEEAPAAPSEPAKTFTVVTADGEAREYEDPSEAANVLANLLTASAKAGGQKGLDGVWESNGVTVGAIREAKPELADALHQHFTEASKALSEAAKPEGEGKKTDAPTADAKAPPSPLKHAKAPWPPLVDYLAKRIEAMTGDELRDFLGPDAPYAAELDFIGTNRKPDWARLMAIADAKKPQQAAE